MVAYTVVLNKHFTAPRNGETQIPGDRATGCDRENMSVDMNSDS
jgi:hypothetical protein